MGSADRRRWCFKTLTTWTIKGYHVLIIASLLLFTAYLIFEPSVSTYNLSEIISMKAEYKAKLNETQTFAANIEHQLDATKTKQSNVQTKLESSLDRKNRELNDIKANNAQLKSYITRLTKIKLHYQNETEIQKKRIQQLQQLSNTNKSPKNENNYRYTQNYKNWIQGIGDSFMWNNESDSNCIFQQNSFILHKDPPINADTLYEGATYCQKYRFSHMFERTIAVRCDYISGQEPEKAGIKYYEYEGILNGRPPQSNDAKWVELSFEHGKKNQFSINLQDDTQTTWVYCNNAYDFHISLLPLTKSDEEQYDKKKQDISDNFGDNKVPPNIVLFIVSGTSRSNFMRAATESVNYLNSMHNNYNGKSPSDILQFFRYSTVGTGARNNLDALIAGKCDYCALKSSDDNTCDGIATFYDRLGYYVWGLNEYRNSFKVKIGNLCDFHLRDNVFPKGCKYGHGIQVETAAEFVKQAIHSQLRYDKSVPHLMILDVESNRVQNGEAMYNLDRFIRSMVEVVHKQNTLIHIISDRGIETVDDDLYSEMEYKNPVNVLLLPKWLSAERKVNLQHLQINQQRLVQHYDMHLFYKELLWKLLSTNELKSFASSDKKRDKLYKSMIFENLVKIDGVPFAKSIMDDVIGRDRNCDGTADGFCFCDTMQVTDIEEKVVYMEIILNAINEQTGNGEWGCHQLDITQFIISVAVENGPKTLLKIAVSKVKDDGFRAESDKLWKENRLLTFSATFKRENIESEYKLLDIERIGGIKCEQCLTTDYYKKQFWHYNDFEFEVDGQLQPMFISKVMSLKMLGAQKSKATAVNLALCYCKYVDLNDIKMIETVSDKKVSMLMDKDEITKSESDVNGAADGVNGRGGKRKDQNDETENADVRQVNYRNETSQQLVDQNDEGDVEETRKQKRERKRNKRGNKSEEAFSANENINSEDAEKNKI